MKSIKSKISPIKFMAIMLFIVFGLSMILSPSNPKVADPIVLTSSSATSTTPVVASVTKNSKATTNYKCGGGADAVYTSIDFGCKGQGSALVDLIFAIIRFLSDGIGIVVVASIIVGGIQYIGSRGEPNATSQAINRIRGSLIALLIYVFAYAILNYVIPVGFFNQ